MPDTQEIRLSALEKEVRALIITRSGDYQITTAKIWMVRLQDGSYRTSYPDHYQVNGKIYQLHRIDRKNNTIVFQEGQ